MNLILTHEQADFDALASLWAAHLLEPAASPVLPRRLNRNVRAFLTLYGDQFSFVDADDLPRGPIEKVTLVDTQSLPSLRGLARDASINLIDHHPIAPDLDRRWRVQIEELGATATLLVEALQDAGLRLDGVTATLLLLGIYEDTGSLSYAATNHRDLLAGAWLLEQGASLAQADAFLNHPLSAEQRRLYDRLLAAAETVQLHGLSIVIAGAQAEGMVDEVSTLAHKLRDLFDPAGLFVLVALDGTIQLVARSNSDALDVARISAAFGGGGHSRAAAALIRGRTIDEVRSELLGLLDKEVRPATTVGEIMSRGPQVLDPKTKVSEAAERMQRFGHEGYPVVDGRNVVGLLTRRAVDRAMAHGMGGRPVASVMDAGELVVHPEDSVAHLQRVMIQQDWGQVPVADPEGGDIVGIVTRTDLLKTLAADAAGARPARLAERMESALPGERIRLLRMIAREAEHLGYALYIVGGFVRDLLLGTPGADLDLVVEGDAIGLARAMADRYGGRISSHKRFGTAKWHLDPRDAALTAEIGVGRESEVPGSIDLVSARTEFYAHPTALPSVQRGSIKLDLHRRDFTINTLALRLDGRHYGELLDPWGGGRDLQDRLVRVLHSISFVDDPTRMLRAVRLEQRLGFSIEARTLELMQQAMPLIDRVSGERIRNELKAIFHEGCRAAILRRLAELGLLAAIHPSLIWDTWLEARFEAAADFHPPDAWRLEAAPSAELLLYSLWLVRLDPGDAISACLRLHFAGSIQAAVLDANDAARSVANWPAGLPPSEAVARLDAYRENSLVAAWLTLTDMPDPRRIIEAYLTVWRWIHPTTDGARLRALGVAPGPAYREILARLRAAWLDGQIESQAEEQGLAEALIEEGLRLG
jgi:tRNA nucleotidyltransferase (CCA-adding enzyme)